MVGTQCMVGNKVLEWGWVAVVACAAVLAAAAAAAVHVRLKHFQVERAPLLALVERDVVRRSNTVNII